jgi:3-hydroxyacyl-CoA dehydrogenase
MVFARAGWQVRLFDPQPAQVEAAHAFMAQGLAEQVEFGLCADAPAALARIHGVASLEAALVDADWVQENSPEVVDVKRELFATLDRLAPPAAIIASSTSAIPASQFTAGLPGRARCLVAHPVNPPHLVPVVEICGASWTAPATLERARVVMAEVGQVPVLVRREVEGFIINRLQGALLSEAMRLVGEGYVEAEDLDKTIRDGLGLRWSFMGPFETIELNAPGGIPDYCARFGAAWTELASKPVTPELWGAENIARVAASWGRAPSPEAILDKQRWRDDRLAALVAHKRGQAKAP